MDFAVPADYSVKLKECEKKNKYPDLAWELKKNCGTWKCYWWSWYQKIGKETGELGNKRTSRDHPNYSIIKISLKTKKSPGEYEETCYHSNSSEKPSANAGVKNSQRRMTIIITELQSVNERKQKINKCLDLAWEQKNLCNMKVTVIPIILGTKGTIA